MNVSKATPKNIWMVTREYGDLAGAGGVKDVTLQLSRSLATWNGRKISVVLPMYGFMSLENTEFKPLKDPLFPDRPCGFDVDMNYANTERREWVEIWHGKKDRVNIYLIKTERFLEKKDVYTYSNEEAEGNPDIIPGDGHFDYFAMNVLLQKAALQLIIALGERPDIIHCHDGHTALIPALVAESAYLKGLFRRCGFLVTIHNGGVGYHQEVSDLPFARAITGLPWAVILKGGLQDTFDPFLAAGNYALMNTVSENYARELRETEEDEKTGWLGHQLVMNGVELTGITNGIDPDDFDPRMGFEPLLDATFDPKKPGDMEGKHQCKQYIMDVLAAGLNSTFVEQFGYIQAGDGPLFTFIGRLINQKGIDIIRDSLHAFLGEDNGARLLILGSGSNFEERALQQLAMSNDYDGRLCFLKGYDTDLAKVIYGAGDFFLVPSRYEPCGLTDFIAQLYGNLPIVHYIGGLVKVVDNETGLTYHGNSEADLVSAIKRGIVLYNQPGEMARMRKNAVLEIEKKYTWKRVMQNYLVLYKKAIERKIAD